jgi:hypothetical protein
VVKISNKFVAFENLDEYVVVNRAWESTGMNINILTKKNLGHCVLNQKKL